MVICHIPSIPERFECLQRTISSIYNQVDKIYIALNGYGEIPYDVFRFANCELLDNSLGDAAKWLHVNDDIGYHVFVDDDLILPQTFVDTLRRGSDKYGGAVSFHGKSYSDRPILRYRRNYTANYRCLGGLDKDVKVDILGTGCMLFDNTQIILDQSVYEHKNMADVLFSRFCVKNNIPMTVLAHKGGWIRYMPQKITIWNTSYDDTIQTKIINEYLGYGI
jgi:hypothetical protein